MTHLISKAMATRTILVIDEDRAQAREIQRMISSLGFDAPAAASSAEESILLASRLSPELCRYP